MSIVSVVAGVAASDLEASVQWYSEVLGRAPNLRPMDGMADWQFAGGGGLLLFEDAGQAGHSRVIFAEDDIDGRVWALKAKGIKIGPITRSEQSETALVRDPDGNLIEISEPA